MNSLTPTEKIKALINKGVTIPNPHHIEIGDDVDIGKISGKDVTIHVGCKIFGDSTFIHHGAKIGYEAPVTIEHCQVGNNVELNGGFFRNAVFLRVFNSEEDGFFEPPNFVAESVKFALEHVVNFICVGLFRFHLGLVFDEGLDVRA